MNAFKSFNRFAESPLSAAEGSNPPPLVLPVTRGRVKEGA
jgi:hypothetical protein